MAASATVIGLDRERAFFPIGLIVIASRYVLFAVMGASRQALTIEIVVASGFLLLAVLGFKRNLWFAVAVIIGHGVFDSVHHGFIENPGVPNWWPGFCLAFDVILGAWLALCLMTGFSPSFKSQPGSTAEDRTVESHVSQLPETWVPLVRGSYVTFRSEGGAASPVATSARAMLVREAASSPLGNFPQFP